MGNAALWVAVAGAMLASALLVYAALALLRLLRSQPQDDQAPAPELAAPLAPEDEREDAYRRAQLEARRARQLASLAMTLDLDAVASQVVEAAAMATRADAAAIRVLQEGGQPLVKSMNLQPGEEAPSIE